MATVANAKLAALSLSDEQARAMAWERLILLREARRMGIAVSDGELARTITSQFGGGGSFDPARYQALIRGVAQVDPETYDVRADGELLVCEPADVLPMAQRYFLF